MKLKRLREVRVIVLPDMWGYSEPKGMDQDAWDRWSRQQLEAAEAIAKAIKRHVDGIEQAAVRWDTETVCSYCGYEWEDEFDGPDGPGCCRKAQDEWKENTHAAP